MPLKRRTPESAPTAFEPLPNMTPGDYEGRLVYVADLGLQAGMIYRGEQKKDTQQIALGFEIIGETIELDGQDFPRVLWTNPFNVFSALTAKGKELVFYSIFVPDAKENQVPQWEKQLGKPASIVVINAPGKGDNADKLYDNIERVSAIPLKYQENIGEAQIVPFIGDADDEENPCTKALFGLAKYCWTNRIDGNNSDDNAADDDVPY
jgi:hypothetical protein